MFGCELGTPDAGGIDGTEPLGMTAKNGAPGGSFVWVVVETGKRVKRGTAGFLRLSTVCQAAAGGIILLTSAIWWVWWGCWGRVCGSDGLNGCRSWATRWHGNGR